MCLFCFRNKNRKIVSVKKIERPKPSQPACRAYWASPPLSLARERSRPSSSPAILPSFLFFIFSRCHRQAGPACQVVTFLPSAKNLAPPETPRSASIRPLRPGFPSMFTSIRRPRLPPPFPQLSRTTTPPGCTKSHTGAPHFRHRDCRIPVKVGRIVVSFWSTALPHVQAQLLMFSSDFFEL